MVNMSWGQNFAPFPQKFCVTGYLYDVQQALPKHWRQKQHKHRNILL